MKPNLGIDEKNLIAVQDLLNHVLADGNIFYIKLRNFHWNVKGKDFMEYHLLFEEQYTALAEAIDAIAERVTTLGGIAIGTAKEFAEYSSLEETPGKVPPTLEMVKELVQDHETIIQSLREKIDACEEKYKDVGSADFLTGLLTDHEKMAWKLRQYLV
ncbi:DNA protection during starvation protein 2 [Candidatus Ornithobacterium hominis]|uniref:DNA protection during starvation protein 2 n=1 Tax=Candidatus Ornithobacterium hominis TaxID=2497989 RepID=A0A383TW86_9FLAO|nr:DNA starvation/stationary phase protection protein [Candidatus Ornithobacterium hominis]MCT7904836.1 DNA starvation/stationary phase protection protein [Candidatus Ornithobacterium hominis]SZD71607.1 DNA protection during starvation protein 2 [Candidatus Ornithobacterium hominis]